MMSLLRLVGIRHMRLKPWRSVLSVTGIACGIALYVAIAMINDATSNYFRDSMSAVTGSASLSVTAGELGFREDTGERIESVAGVQAAVPVLETRSWVVSDLNFKRKKESIMVLGVDLLQEKSVRSYQEVSGKPIINDAMSFISQPDSVMVTKTFANEHQLRMGDRFELSSAQGRTKLKIRGILAEKGAASAYGGALAIMDIDSARLAFGKKGKTDRIDVALAKDADVEAIAVEIRKALGPGYSVERPEMLSKQMDKMINSFRIMSGFFSMMALIVGIFLIANSVAMSIAERRKEIGTLRALGTRKFDILKLLVAEATTVGLVGAFIGSLLGKAVAHLMVGAVTQSMSNQFAQRVEASDLKLTTAMFFLSLGIGAVSAAIAAFIPALKAIRIEPVEAMRVKDNWEKSRSRGFHRYSGRAGVSILLFGGYLSYEYKDPGHPIALLFMQVAAILGSALIGPALVLGLARFFRPAIARMSKIVPRLAVDNILRSPRRTAGNVMSLMVGLTLVVSIACVNVSFKETLLQFFARILHADLLISSTGRLQAHETQPLSEGLKKEIDANPAVLGSYELREIRVPYSGDQVLLKSYGEPPVPEVMPGSKAIPKRYDIWDMKDRDTEAVGRDLFHSTDPTIMVSDNFVLHFQKKTGDTLELMTARGPQNFRIVGVASEFANPVGSLFISRKNYKEFFNDHLVGGFAVKLKRGYDASTVSKQLEEQLSVDFPITILLNSDIREQVESVIDSSFAYTRAIKIAALFVALLGLMNTMLISVMERRRELGVVRAMGMNRSQLGWMIMFESMGQGGLGAIVAVVMGAAVGGVWVSQNLAAAVGWFVDFYIPWATLLHTIVLGVLVSCLAAWYPAWRASRSQVVEALNYE